MTRILFIALVTASLFLAPTAAAEDPGQGDGPGEDQGPPDHSNAGGNQSGQSAQGPDEGDEGGLSSNETAQTSAAASRQSCRLIGWDGGDPEPTLNPLLGVIVIDPDGCGYGILDQFPPR